MLYLAPPPRKLHLQNSSTLSASWLPLVLQPEQTTSKGEALVAQVHPPPQVDCGGGQGVLNFWFTLSAFCWSEKLATTNLCWTEYDRTYLTWREELSSLHRIQKLADSKNENKNQICWLNCIWWHYWGWDHQLMEIIEEEGLLRHPRSYLALQ